MRTQIIMLQSPNYFVFAIYGMEITSELRPKADLAADSAILFPLTPMWLGIRHKIIFFL